MIMNKALRISRTNSKVQQIHADSVLIMEPRSQHIQFTIHNAHFHAYRCHNLMAQEMPRKKANTKFTIHHTKLHSTFNDAAHIQCLRPCTMHSVHDKNKT